MDVTPPLEDPSSAGSHSFSVIVRGGGEVGSGGGGETDWDRLMEGRAF